MKQAIKKITAATALALSLISVSAQAECHISQAACPVAPSYSNQFFRDGDPVAQVDPNRCMQRAREYHVWCRGAPGVATSAYFSSQGVYKLAATVSAFGFTLYATDVINARWFALQPKY